MTQIITEKVLDVPREMEELSRKTKGVWEVESMVISMCSIDQSPPKKSKF